MNKTTRALKIADSAIALAKISTNRSDDIRMYDEALAVIREALAETVTISCDCGDIYERNSFGGKFIQQYGCCPNCDAAEPVKQEPVADKVLRLLEPFMPVDAKAIRAEALEEAAKVCQKIFNDTAHWNHNRDAIKCAAAIRGLK